jgi:hypothetical protein
MSEKALNRPENFQGSKESYGIPGILTLKKVIMGTIGKGVLLVNPREKMPSYFVGNPFRIKSLELTLKWLWFNEVVHLSLILVSAVIGYFFWARGYMAGVYFMGLVVLLNLGLALLQRSNRTRIHRTIRTLENRKLK